MMKGLFFIMLGLYVLDNLGLVRACNEAICASLVSKCLFIRSCECDMSDKKNCTCCGDCQLCLAKLYSECCSCVGMCPMPDPEDSIFRTSSIEVLSDPIPELFNVLTEEEDYLKRWTSHKYPVYFDILSSSQNEFVKEADMGGQSMSHIGIPGPYNCTVAFMSECTSLRKCKQSCKSMGSAKYRWFHDQGCCQCIGDTCIDYGLNEAQCLACKGEEDEDSEDSEGESIHDVALDENEIEMESERHHKKKD